jgi:hypothetical protein
MNAEAIVSVSAAVVALTTLVKWAGIKDTYGPIAVMILSLAGVALWGYSLGTYERTQLFGYFAGWIAVTTGAAGVFGFTRSAPASVTDGSRNSALPGAAQNPTEKPSTGGEERRDR